MGNMRNKKINIYCGWHRSTIIKQRPIIKNDFIFQIKCFECNGSGILIVELKKKTELVFLVMEQGNNILEQYNIINEFSYENTLGGLK